MRPRTLILVILFMVPALICPALAAAAQSTPHAFVSGVDYASGTVTVTVQFDAPVSRVYLVGGGAVIASVECVPSQTEASFGGYALVGPVSLGVVGYLPDGSPAWARSITIDPTSYRPPKPRLLVASGKVVPSRFSLSCDAGVPFTSVRASVSGDTRSTVVTMSTDSTSVVRLDSLAIPYGRTTLGVTVSNGFGTSPKGSAVVYNLGTNLPTRSRYELVSKTILWMFDVKNGRVIHAWPVAIGTPQTPTPSGSFTLGKARAAGGAWGVLRRRLYRDIPGRKNTPTSYYIHGTNAPWSIGMKASHGCVRMYNTHVRQFAKVVPVGTYVRIR